MIQIIRMMLQKDGIPSLYKGMEAKLYQTVLATALMFFCYENIVSFVFSIMRASSANKKNH